jgi:hypothetical protein
MGAYSNDNAELRLRLEASMDLLALSFAQLKDVIFAGPDDAVEFAGANLRLARFRFLEARADYREACESAGVSIPDTDGHVKKGPGVGSPKESS